MFVKILSILVLLQSFSTALSATEATIEEERGVLNPSCTLTPIVGSCLGGYQRWFYDDKKKRCKKFKYGGCGGNENRFYTWGRCILQCPYIKRANLNCLQPKIVGPCHSSIRRYYYNAVNERCQVFNYGGCLGNNNRFETKRECESNCPARQGCIEPKKRGPCDGYHPRYYFNKRTRQCEQFIFGGCSANGNNFNSKNDCEKECPIEVRKSNIIRKDIYF